MKKLLSTILLIFIISCGIGYAHDYSESNNEDTIEISGLGGRCYRVFLLAQVDSQSGIYIQSFCFEESGNFTWKPFSADPDYSGSYTQTGSTFAIHCEWGEGMGWPHEFNLEGTSVLDVFIYGNLTGEVTSDEGGGGDEVLNWRGVFFGMRQLL